MTGLNINILKNVMRKRRMQLGIIAKLLWNVLNWRLYSLHTAFVSPALVYQEQITPAIRRGHCGVICILNVYV